jgi:hypothetical protein
MTIEAGHGGLKRNRIPAKTVKPKGKGKTGWVELLVKGSKAVSAGTSEEAAPATESSDARAIRQVGAAGASIAETYKEKQAAKNSSGGSSGGR